MRRVGWPTVLLLGLLFQWAHGAGDPKGATILVPELNLRSGPGRHHPPIAALPQGARVLVLSYEGEWVRILYDEQTGFIMNRERYLRIDEAAAPGPGRSAPTDAPTELDRELEASEQRMADFAKAEMAVINALDDTEQALNRARRQVAQLTEELDAIAHHIGELERQHRAIEARTATSETYAANRLVALYKLSWLGKFHVLASADSMFDFFARKHSLEQILAHDEAVLTDLAEEKAQMQALLEKVVAGKHAKQSTAERLNRRIDTMNAEQARREGLLEEVRSQKNLQLAAIASLRESARDLDRTVDAFQQAPPEADPPAAVVEKPFNALKGLLMMPVKGKIVSFFGRYKDDRYNVTHFQSGIRIEADRGEPVRAVYSGRTLYASWFKGFGNMMIIDHGDHYYTVYAHLEEQFKAKGDGVEAGEVIATVGDTGSLTGAGLHFEIRHHGKPVNPLGWIKKG